MITVKEVKGTANGGDFTMYGLSSDTKPTGNYLGMAIDNGSTFFEIDTQNVAFYDSVSETWK